MADKTKGKAMADKLLDKMEKILKNLCASNEARFHLEGKPVKPVDCRVCPETVAKCTLWAATSEQHFMIWLLHLCFFIELPTLNYLNCKYF